MCMNFYISWIFKNSRPLIIFKDNKSDVRDIKSYRLPPEKENTFLSRLHKTYVICLNKKRVRT